MINKHFTEERRLRRKARVRAKVSGTASRPRLSVFRSLKHISVQAIDDVAGKTLAAATLRDISAKTKNTLEGATAVGKLIAEKCVKLGVTDAVFDRSGYKYHGRVKALADAARDGGLKF